MTTLANYSGHWSSSKQFSQSQDSYQNHGAAMEYYKRAKRRGTLRRLQAKLTGRSVNLQHFAANGHLTGQHATTGVQIIPLDQIIGSEGRSQDFDNQFWPITDHTRDRWINIAMAMGTGKPLPPVQLIESVNGYVVRDGNHRISVARALGQELIEAEIN